jgi:hypothetical protein
MTGVHLWWLLLSLIGVFNIGLWFFSAARFARQREIIDPVIHAWRPWVLRLSAVYVLVCAFRSFLPRIDLERVCLVNTWLSNMFIGRSLATLAELSFIVQCAILLREAGRGARLKPVSVIAWLIVPLIVVAESFSWYAILTTNYFGSVVEESLWAIAGGLLVLCFIALWPRVGNSQRYFMSFMIAYAIGFVVFMASVDVPMYWTRWQADLASHTEYLSLLQGFADVFAACRVDFSWHVWREEIPWMTLYFSVTVWVSIAFAHAPSYKRIRYGNNSGLATPVS